MEIKREPQLRRVELPGPVRVNDDACPTYHYQRYSKIRNL